MNVTLFRNTIFADTVKIPRGHTGLQWASNPMTSDLFRRGHTTYKRNTGRKAIERQRQNLEQYGYKPGNAGDMGAITRQDRGTDRCLQGLQKEQSWQIP